MCVFRCEPDLSWHTGTWTRGSSEREREKKKKKSEVCAIHDMVPCNQRHTDRERETEKKEKTEKREKTEAELYEADDDDDDAAADGSWPPFPSFFSLRRPICVPPSSRNNPKKTWKHPYTPHLTPILV